MTGASAYPLPLPLFPPLFPSRSPPFPSSDSGGEDAAGRSASRRLVGQRHLYKMFLLDARASSLAPEAGGKPALWLALDIVQEQMRQSVLSGSSDRIGVLLLGTKNSLCKNGDPGLWLLAPCTPPGVEDIQAVRTLGAAVAAEASGGGGGGGGSSGGSGSEPAGASGDGIGAPGVGASRGDLPLLAALNLVQDVFQGLAKAGHDTCQLFVLTNEPSPVRDKKAELQRFRDLFDAGVEVVVLPLSSHKGAAEGGFDASQFWEEASSSRSTGLFGGEVVEEEEVPGGKQPPSSTYSASTGLRKLRRGGGDEAPNLSTLSTPNCVCTLPETGEAAGARTSPIHPRPWRSHGD